MGLSVEQVAATYARPVTKSGADYDVLATSSAIKNAHLAMSKAGSPALLVPVSGVGSKATRLTHGLALRGATKVVFAKGKERWTASAAVIECRDPRLAHAFTALVAALVVRIESTTLPSWESVSSLFAEWERLLARREILSGETELGLWAELWCLVHSSRGEVLFAGWRGPEAERVDFLLGGYGFEIKAGRRPNVHMVSQDQVDHPLGDVRGILVSMHVMPDPLRGRTLAELVGVVSKTCPDVAEFEEKLAATGYSRADEDAYHRKYAVLEAPRFYRIEDVPRVRLADPGVSRIRFRAELDAKKSLAGQPLARAASVLGIVPSAHEYPCA